MQVPAAGLRGTDPHAEFCYQPKCPGDTLSLDGPQFGRMRCWVYILANKKGLTYVGVAHNLRARLREHYWRRNQFTAKYRVTRLVYIEAHSTIEKATTRERQIKGWRRSKKHALIEAENPGWSDLSEPFR